MKVVVELDAAADVEDAYLWYLEQDRAVAVGFREAFDAAVALAQEQPRAYEILHRATRRVMLRRFPYGVFYRIEGDTMVVVACMHLTRAPAAWQSR